MHENALNCDRIAREEFTKLSREFGVRTAVETGTYHGITTEFLASLVPVVHTIEIRQDFLDIALQHISGLSNVHTHLGNSPDILHELLPALEQPIFCFLDAHWGDYCPLLDEVISLVDSGVRNPVIVVHDFLVPGTTLGYDTYQGRPFELSYLEHYFPSLYPGGYRAYYNDERAEGARRGILYVIPLLDT